MKPQCKYAEVPQSSISMQRFSVASSSSRISQLSGFYKQINGKQCKYHHCKLLRALSFSRMLAEFFLKFVYSTMCGKNFQIYGVHNPRKCIESRHFYSCPPLPTQNFPPSSYRNTLGREKLLIPPAALFQKSVSPNSRKG